MKSMAEVLDAAKLAVAARGDDYGIPRENHARTAVLWRAYFESVYGERVTITDYDVCVLNILQKISRAAHSFTDDTAVDIAGYAANMWACMKGGSEQ